MKIHESVTAERIIEAAERQMLDGENLGICVRCGEDQEGCEPDASGYRCESCRHPSVYGAEQLLLMSPI